MKVHSEAILCLRIVQCYASRRGYNTIMEDGRHYSQDANGAGAMMMLNLRRCVLANLVQILFTILMPCQLSMHLLSHSFWLGRSGYLSRLGFLQYGCPAPCQVDRHHDSPG